MLSTLAALRTRTGTSCVIVVSLTLDPPWKSKLKSRSSTSPKPPPSSLFGTALVPAILDGLLMVFVTIVRERRGMLSFFVSRRDADVALRAERSAR